MAPDHFDALHFWGVLEAQRGRLKMALEFIERALHANPQSAEAYSNLGNVLLQMGRNEEALNKFDKALVINPGNVDALYNRGNILRDLKRGEEALSSYEAALLIDPRNIPALVNRGNLLRNLKRYQEAKASLEKALTIKPGEPGIFLNLGIIQRELGRYAEALTYYDRALALKPDFVDALGSLGNLLRELGRHAEALVSYGKALQIAPSHDASWLGFSECLRYTNIPDKSYEPLVLRALKKDNLDPQNAQPAAVDNIVRDPLTQEFLRLTETLDACAQQLEIALDNGRLQRLLEMPLLLAVLEETIITNPCLERLLTVLRRVLLFRVTRSWGVPAPEILERFVCGLALQCFGNEYVWAESEEERQAITVLTDRMARAVESQDPVPVISLGIVAAYQALYKLNLGSKIQSLLQSDNGIREVIKRQLTEPNQEARIREKITSLTRIDNEVSKAVQQQYEENPYPRWRRKSIPAKAQSVTDFLRDLFPHQVIHNNSAERPEILVAGCGTGSHPTQSARQFRNARILAVDLSLSSLAYAQRVTTELGITNVEYQQADISGLRTLGRQFDLIEAVGVLHHMSDPLHGWRILTSLLRQGGYMRIGLYSDRARQHVAAVRRLINERSYAPAPEGIRQCRQEIMTSRANLLLEGDLGGDFYTMSSCRDLLFHVEEHLYSPAKIRTVLDQLGLQFLGFALANDALEHLYRDRFPEDIACDSLANWELFEADHPATFRTMFQFWVRKN